MSISITGWTHQQSGSARAPAYLVLGGHNGTFQKLNSVRKLAMEGLCSG